MRKVKPYALGLIALLVFNTACVERDENGEQIAIKFTNFIEARDFGDPDTTAFKFEPKTDDYYQHIEYTNLSYIENGQERVVEIDKQTIISYDENGMAVQVLSLHYLPAESDFNLIYAQMLKEKPQKLSNADYILSNNFIFVNETAAHNDNPIYKQALFTKEFLSAENTEYRQKEAEKFRYMDFLSKPYITQKQKDAVKLDYGINLP